MTRTQQKNILNLIRKDFVARKEKNSSYSLRAYARDLGVDPSNLSKALNGKKEISAATIKKVAPKLNVNPVSMHQALTDDKAHKPLSIDVFQLVAEWYHDAILELTRIKDFVPDVKWIAKRLGITKTKCQAAVERLQKLEMLEIDDDNNWSDVSGDNTIITDDITSTAQRMYQKEILAQAAKAIDEVPKELRNHSSFTFAVSTKKLKEAKAEIARFQERMCEILEEESLPKDDVYHMSVALFPINYQNREKKQEQ